jgi:hypothetical protein
MVCFVEELGEAEGHGGDGGREGGEGNGRNGLLRRVHRRMEESSADVGRGELRH